MTKKVTILGSTGSIGLSTLRVIKLLEKDFSIYGLACARNLDLLEEQIIEFNPSVVAVGAPSAYESEQYKLLRNKYKGIEFLEDEDGIIELSGRKSDILVSAIVGAAGLKPTYAAIGPAKRIALANKETLVIAGKIVKEKIQEKGIELIPVDSEHSAIFSLIQNINPSYLDKIILTASGGSLRDVEVKNLSSVGPKEALNHPTWDMGAKITIDSATLMNKGLEVIEAHYLFDVDYDNIEIIIHPESIVHSLIETIDGAMYAHIGIADMALPILNAFTYPEKTVNPFGKLKLDEVGTLQFNKYDKKRFPAIELCYEAGKIEGTMPAALNAANEVAVNAFLDKKILFTDIVKVVEKAMRNHSANNDPSLEDIMEADLEIREMTNRIIKGVQ